MKSWRQLLGWDSWKVDKNWKRRKGWSIWPKSWWTSIVDVDCGRRLWTVPFTELMSDSAEGSTFWRCYIQKVLPFYKDHFWFILFLTMLVLAKTNNIRKQRSKGALRKNCSDNMQQICRRTPIPKCDFNKVALQPYWNRTSVWLFSCKVAVCFQNTFSEEHLWTAASEYILC